MVESPVCLLPRKRPQPSVEADWLAAPESENIKVKSESLCMAT
jgi:hypothetical protein